MKCVPFAAGLLLAFLVPAAAGPDQVSGPALVFEDCALNAGWPMARQGQPMERILPTIKKTCHKSLAQLSKVYPADIVLEDVMIALEKAGAKRLRQPATFWSARNPRALSPCRLLDTVAAR